MGEDMWQLLFTKLLLISIVLTAVIAGVRSDDTNFENDNIRATRIDGDSHGVTTVLLVSARPGKSIPPVGVLTKTARTFVQDGASTEFATQVLGTTLDNGRLYARILSTSSRVFYEKEPSVDPTSPYVVYPSKAVEYDWQSNVDLSTAPIKAIEEIEVTDRNKESLGNHSEGSYKFSGSKTTTRLDDLARKNDIFSKRELGSENQRFKPVKVRPADYLATYTVKQEYVSNNFDIFENEQPKVRPRLPKIFKPPAKATQRRIDSKPLATVTYHGFADFTTTVGDTVIVFSPSTSQAPAGRPATTIKGDATLRPDDGVAVVKIRPTVVAGDHKKTDSPFMIPQDNMEDSINHDTDELLDIVNRGNIQPSVVEEHDYEVSSSVSQGSGGRPAVTIKNERKKPDLFKRPQDHIEASMNHDTDELLGIVNSGNIQPSVVDEPEIDLSSRSTEPLLLIPDFETNSIKPTGLLKVIDSTTSLDGTTTRYKSLIYGTYIGTNYAQVIHTSSNVYFFPNTATLMYGDEDTTAEYESTHISDAEEEQDTTIDMEVSTTPQMPTTREESSPELNELTTPFKDTTDNAVTTLKDMLESARKYLDTTDSSLPPFDDGIPNDILSGDPQGRSISGGSFRNDYGQEKNKAQRPDFVDSKQQITFATKLLPSTTYKTFTKFTTFFIPGSNGVATTSVRSREVVSSEVTYLTELILPSSTESTILPTKSHTSITPQLPLDIASQLEPEQTTKQDEEIELIFKTLYTTYTYLTTFFQKNTSSISSREVVETNVITQTVGPNGVSAAVADLFENNEPAVITPTKISQSIMPSIIIQQGEDPTTTAEYSDFAVPDIEEESLTTTLDDETTVSERVSTVPTVPDDEFDGTEKGITELEASPTPPMATDVVKYNLKTYYTTVTYFTTTFVDNETEIETRTEVTTNIVTEMIQPSPTVPVTLEYSTPTTPTPPSNKPVVPPEILAYLAALEKRKSQEEAFLVAKKVQAENNAAEQVNQLSDTTVVTDMTTEDFTTEFPTTLEQQSSTEDTIRELDINGQVTPNPPINGEILGSMITDVLSSSSSGGGTVLDIMDKRNAVPEDQELSESNHQDVEPPPTLLLQTSYTTFTYFTTMYKGDSSNVASRLETVTNIATETIRPTAALPATSSTLPVTYFTTFTYWTTFYKGGDTLTSSREETVSTVVTPEVAATPTVQLEMLMTYRPDAPSSSSSSSSSPSSSIEEQLFSERQPKATADNEVTPSDISLPEKSVLDTTPSNTKSNDNVTESLTISPEPTTYYTTYTYFTTTYAGNETILNSRLETVTSVYYPNVTEQGSTGRAVDGAVRGGVQELETESKSITPSKAAEIPKTGLISTVRSSKVNDDVTTHYMTDVYGTFIDGLYAQVVESSTSLETPSSVVATPVLPTGVLSLNKGSVIDADGVTTIYFTTRQIGTSIDGMYAKVIENSSSTKIDEEKKLTIKPAQGHRTGLVRLIEGQIENDGITTYYQSKVIGTSIEGRYAQIIESTSSFAATAPTLSIAPTSTLPPSTSIGTIDVSPSPAVIQSSLSDDPTTESPDHDEDSDEEEENEKEIDQKDERNSRKKSRLTFSTRKRSFIPTIRPFASRSRPTFNPIRKGAQGATTITRTDITPTITATLAGKGNRFASSRNRISSPIGPYSSTVSPTGSRRFAGRRNTQSSSSTLSSATVGPRGRGQSRISPSSVQGNRRTPATVRGSSRGSQRGSSSVYPGASSRYRLGIRASSTLLRGQSTIRQDDQDNDANEFTTTTLVTEETPYTQETDDGETVTIPLQTTTESSRRSTNPLVRLRRPINLSGSSRAPTTPKPSTRNGKSNSPSVPNRSTSSRLNNRPTPPTSTRPRPTNAGFFRPREYFGRKQETPVEDPIEDIEEDDEDLEEDLVDEIADNDYEGSEHEAQTTPSNVNSNRRFGKTVGPVPQIKPFGLYGRGRRVRRQANQLRSLTSRYRKSKQPTAMKVDEIMDTIGSPSNVEDTTKASTKPVNRYSARTRTPTAARPNLKTPNNPDKSQTDSTETLMSQSNKPNGRTKQSNNGNGRSTSSRIKPSPTSNSSRQFTLREKDQSQPRSSYKRTQSSGARTTVRTTNKSAENGKSRPSRLRSNSGKSPVEFINSSRRVSSSRASSRTPSRNGNGRKSTRRGGSSHEDIRESPIVQPNFDGTITVTHYVPTEVTIPVVSNGVTEQRNIITAHLSTEVLGPSQYSTVAGGDGRSLVVIVSESTGINSQGQTEITRFLLHETPTTRVSHTLTTFGGRRASQSVIVPTTIYSVENVVSTIRPSLPANPPLANILLSQLLLGQLNPQNQLLQPQGTPTTQYNTRTTTYVTTITKHQSTVIPLTFRGKEILTTLIDSSSDVITATEFITDTVVVTPTATLPAANLNSLLLLLQQPQQQIQPNPNPLLDPVFAAAPLLTQSNTLPGEVERRHQPADSDYKPDSYEYSDEEVEEYEKPSRGRSPRPHDRPHDRKENHSAVSKAESSVLTLYVSGRRPGEFSTVLSTVKVGEQGTASRRRRDASETVKVQPSIPPSLHAGPEPLVILTASEDTVDTHTPTQSLESVVGEQYNGLNYNENLSQEYGRSIEDTDDPVNKEENQTFESPLSDDPDEHLENRPRKRVRIRVPVARTKAPRKHKVIVVRRRPLTPSTTSEQIQSTTHTPRRVVTRIRPLGRVQSRHSADVIDPDNVIPESTRHKITITRKRKIEPTPSTTVPKKGRITVKKLVAIRPIEPTPTLAIITAGFFTAPSDDSDEYEDEESTEDVEDDETHPTTTPNLETTPILIDSTPEGEQSEFNAPELEVTSTNEDVEATPVIITDNFFFPPSDDEEDLNYEDDYTETSTSEEISEEITEKPAELLNENENVTTPVSTSLNEDIGTVQPDMQLENVTDSLDREEVTNPVTEDDELNKDSVVSNASTVSISMTTVTSSLINIEATSLPTVTTTTEASEFVSKEDEILETTTPLQEEERTSIEEEEEKTSLEEEEITSVEEEEEKQTSVEEEEITPVEEEEEKQTSVEEEEKQTSVEEEEKQTSIEKEEKQTSIEKEETSPVEEEEEEVTTPAENEETTPLGEEETTPLEEKETTPLVDEDTTLSIEKETTPLQEEMVTPSVEQEKLNKTSNDTVKEISISDVPKISISVDNADTADISDESPEQTTIGLDITEQPVSNISETIEITIEKTPEKILTENTKDYNSMENTDTPINYATEEEQREKEQNEEDEILTVKPIELYIKSDTDSIVTPFDPPQTVVNILSSFTTSTSETFTTLDSFVSSSFDDSYIPSVIPLNAEYITLSTPVIQTQKTTEFSLNASTTVSSPTPEDIESGLVDDLYLSLSRPDFPQILKSKSETINVESELIPYVPLEPSTSIYYTETTVTSTRLRTYTYVVTKLNGLETQVTSSTTVKPKVTTLTMTVPITVTVTPTMESSVKIHSSICSPVYVLGEDNPKEEEEGRRLNLATRVMSNGVEVIVAGPTPALRWENSNPQPTLTLSDAVVMLLPQEKPNDFVTKTCTTTFTYFGAINNSGSTVISTEVVSNTATEERHKKPEAETASVILEASPTLRTEVLKTTYTYLTLDNDHANVEDPVISSTKVVTNTITAPQHYLHMILEPSEVSHPETNTYLSTRVLEKTFMEDGHTKVQTTSDTITQLIVTESAPPPRPTSVTTTLTALDNTEGPVTDVMKTYYITYTYYNTFLEKGTSVTRTNVATSTNVALEKVPAKDTSTTKIIPVNSTPEPIQIFATKTYLTTYTYFTTLLQAGPDGETSTTISSRSHIIENVVTESIAPSLLDAGYMNALLTTAYHSDSVKNVVTGSTIIFFDEEDQIDPTTTSSLIEATTSAAIGKDEKSTENLATTLSTVSSDMAESTVNRVDHINNQDNNNNNTTTLLNDTAEHKRPATQDGGDIQLSNLLNLGTLGNSLSVLTPVFTAMAGLLQAKTTATRRNDTETSSVIQETTTQRSPIYIPVAEFADGDIEVAESQNIAAHLVNPKHNHIAETRHKVTSSLADGIPISPGEIITANSDVIIGKPGKMAPRPPQSYVNNDEHIGMKPPPLPVPNIPVHPVLEIVENNREDYQEQHSPKIHKDQLQIIPSHRIYEEHLKIPLSMSLNAKLQVVPTQPQKLHPIQSAQTNRIESKHEIIEHDPLLKPPDKPGTEKHINKQPEWRTDGSRGPWGATNPLTPPATPVTFSDLHSEKPANDKSWPSTSFKQQKRPNWAQKDSFLPDTFPEVQTSETQPVPSEPIVHQVPHIIDRSTGQPLLVNIQPSQVANVMIPQDGTQALIFGDTGERHISGQYFDDPSPYPEPEVGPGFVGIEKVEDLYQNVHGKDPLNYMVPPSPPSNFKPPIQKTNSSNRPHAIRPLQVRFDHIKPPAKLEPPYNRPDRRPAEIYLLNQGYGSSVTNGQGFVHSEILVHHRPETLNLQLGSHPPMLSNGHSSNTYSSNGQFLKGPKPINILPTVPSRRTEAPTEISHLYPYQNKPDSGNEVVSNSNWKLNKKPPRITPNRPRPQSILRSTTHRPHRPIFIEKPNPHITKTTYPNSQKLPFESQNTGLLSHQVPPNTYLQYPFSNKPILISNKNINNVTNQGITHNYQVKFQDRLPQSHSEKTNPVNTAESIPKWDNNHVPTGAIEYHNPSYVKVKPTNIEYQSPMLIVTSKNHTSDTVRFDVHNQSRPLDSDFAASEYIKSGDADYEKKSNTVVNLKNNTTDSLNNYEQDFTYNRDEIKHILHPGEPFRRNNNTFVSQNETSYITTESELPVTTNKPHHIYNNYTNRDTYYGHAESDLDYKTDEMQTSTSQDSYDKDDIIDLKPPASISQGIPVPDHESNDFYSNTHVIVTPETRPTRGPVVEIITKPTDIPDKRNNTVNDVSDIKTGTLESSINQNSHKEHKIGQQPSTSEDTVNQYARPSWVLGNLDPDTYMPQKNSETKQNEFKNYTISGSSHKESSVQSNTKMQRPEIKTNHPSRYPDQKLVTRIHPGYPYILTKPKLQVPEPVVISSTAMKPDSHMQSNVQFSMPVEVTDDQQNDSKTQTERPPSMLVTKNTSLKNKHQDKEMLETAYQTNFASLDSVIGNSEMHKIKNNAHEIRPALGGSQNILFNVKNPDVPSRDMMPPPLNSPSSKLEDEQQKLKPPPPPSNDVFGLSPPPLEITTTYRPLQHRPDSIHINEQDLKLSSKYIPLKELTNTVIHPQPSMKPPNLRSTVTKPYLVEQHSKRVVPSSPILQTKSFEISTTKVGTMPFGSTQKMNVNVSNNYNNQNIKSKYGATQNTVPTSIIGTPVTRASVTTKRMEYSNIPRLPVQQTMTTANIVTPTQLKSSDDVIKSSKSSLQSDIKPTKSYMFETSHTSIKMAEHPVFLQSSHDHVLPSINTEPTESLTYIVGIGGIKESTMQNHELTKTYKKMNATKAEKLPNAVVMQTDHTLKNISTDLLSKDYVDFKINETTSKTEKPNVGTVIYENVSDTNIGVKPKEIVRIKMSTLTKVETVAVGLPPTTRTFLLTHTMTSTTVETVTETLLHPTSTLSTMTSNTLQSIVTRMPSMYENSIDNDSIFIVMSDQKPPAPGAEEVEAEYEEEDISRDEQSPTNNEIHRVLAGGILGAPVVPIRPTNQCTPECKGSKGETCVEVENEMRCVCRPGFARMFPDRPCKPTYTYTLHVGLDRIGHEPVVYQESLNDSTSTAYRRLAGPVKDALDRTLMQSDLRDIYRALKISTFTSDPMKVAFHVQLSDNANETRLKEVLRKYLVGSNYSLGGTEVYASKNLESIHASDFDECSAEEDGPHHDCSPNAACFNLRGSYQCSCKEGWADLSENPAYPGRICSQAPIGCAGCNNKGHCVTNIHGHEVCECFPWYSGQRCQVNLKVMLIALVTTGAILLGLLAVCVGLACFRQPVNKHTSGDTRAIIPGTGGDTSSEDSIGDVTIPYHVPHVLPPPPQMIAPLPPMKRPIRKVSEKSHHPSRKPVVTTSEIANDEQRDRSLTVMIPRAKYRSVPQSPQNYKTTLSTFVTDEHKLINYLDNGPNHSGNRKQSISSTKDCKESDLQTARTPIVSTGALVSAGFQVSATVTRTMDAESTLARSCGETTIEAPTKVLQNCDIQGDLTSTLARSCGETTIQPQTKLLSQDLGEAGSILARSCEETTIQPFTKMAAARTSSIKDTGNNKNSRDNGSEGHTMAERDLGSTLRLPAHHPPLYSPDRVSDRESNFDSL